MDPRLEAFGRLLNIMDDLREKCPWDRKQTNESLRNLTIEETYELTDAIMQNDKKGIKEELGDLMLHLVFYAKIGSETNDFDITDVLNNVSDKLVRRHPHIYGEVVAEDEETVKRNWEQLKLQEGKKSVLEGVPKSLPALIKAQRIQDKSAKVGFEWENANQVWEKVQEEMREFRETIVQKESKARISDEFGDVLFSLVNYARFLDVDPEFALEKTNIKFKKRFEYIEANAPIPLNEMTLEAMDTLWNESKSLYK